MTGLLVAAAPKELTPGVPPRLQRRPRRRAPPLDRGVRARSRLGAVGPERPREHRDGAPPRARGAAARRFPRRRPRALGRAETARPRGGRGRPHALPAARSEHRRKPSKGRRSTRVRSRPPRRRAADVRASSSFTLADSMQRTATTTKGDEILRIEAKWRDRWEADRAAFVDTAQPAGDGTYLLVMLPYPSGDRLHVGHARTYFLTDALHRYLRQTGVTVFCPMGWDAFGLPAENYAIQKGIHPRTSTLANIAAMKEQFRSWGVLYDWTKEVTTCEPDVLPLEPVVLPEAPREGPRGPQEVRRELVPVVRDRPRERAGRGRRLRPVRHPGRAARARAVVPEDHRLRRPPARRPRHARQVARESRHDAAQLDRKVHGRRPRLRDPRRSARPCASSRRAPTPSTARRRSSSRPSTRSSRASSRTTRRGPSSRPG